MDFGTALSVVQTVFAALQCKELREICSLWGYESKLDELQTTVETVKAVLLDAETKQDNLTHQQKLWIQELKDVVYDADDLLDEFVTVAERKRKHKQHKKLLQEGDRGKVAKKVRLLFYRLKNLGFAHKMSNGVKEVRRKLDNIASNHNQFGFKLDSQPIRKRREETCSYVTEKDIITGREEDVENIVGWLLDGEADQRDVSFLTIVGIGGLGKTTLAQLVCNDKRVANHFGLKLWACISDEDPKHLNAKAVLAKLLRKKTSLDMEELQDQVRKLLAGKKYLLILDDVWNENRDEWLNLVKFFRGNHSGSWVVVTTRSKMTAQVVDGLTYDLQGLSHEHSWDLFTKIAFGQGEDATNMADLKEIGQKIVKKCANVPLAIRVVGSLLYGQGKNQWIYFQEKALAEIKPNDNGIWPMLKLSYYQLESPLKSCFGYCALFPKDFKMSKEKLVDFWMAQGYIIPLEKGQEIEDAAEECFSILLRRCFLQISSEYEVGCIYTMHDLMHDLAQEVVGEEVSAVTSTSELSNKPRHILVNVDNLSKARPSSKIRSMLLSRDSLPVDVHLDKLLVSWTCLRTLQLRSTKTESLPDTIGNLIHLRYLDLSGNDKLKALPHSITKLYNLQTLLLFHCQNLKELPEDLSKLVKLRTLNIQGCDKLTHMPAGMGKLSCLRILKYFVVGESSSSSRQQVVDQLEDLKALINLQNSSIHVKIKIPRNAAAYVKKKDNTSGGGYLSNKKHLDSLYLHLEKEEGDKSGEYEEALLEDLHPPPNLRRFVLDGYKAMSMPNWMEGVNFEASFCNLVFIEFYDCEGLQYLPSMGKLHKLKLLVLWKLPNLEYVEMNTSSSSVELGMTSTRAAVVANPPFFPSLEKLWLNGLPKLKGWWKPPQVEMRDDEDENTSSSRQPCLLPSFQRLSKLYIEGCPQLTVIPYCPSLEGLTLKNYNEGLRIINQKEEEPNSTFSSPSSLSSSSAPSSKLRCLETSNVKRLKLVLSPEAFLCLETIIIYNDQEMESLGEAEELFRSCSSSLRDLEIAYCTKLRSLCGGLHHLSALVSLDISYFPNLSLEEEAEEKGMPWRSLGHTLRQLTLFVLPKLVKLPKGMQFLTSLHSLKIVHCVSLESMPEWMPKLTSLTRLLIRRCSERLHQRCKESPTGEDWPNIRHIPHVEIIEP